MLTSFLKMKTLGKPWQQLYLRRAKSTSDELKARKGSELAGWTIPTIPRVLKQSQGTSLQQAKVVDSVVRVENQLEKVVSTTK